MKAFIIYVPFKKSIEYANSALKSFNGYTGWEPELFEGVTINTLPKYNKLYDLKTKKPSRVETMDPLRYSTKKACALNHYRLFKQCVEFDEPIAIIEHDSHCIGNWEDASFDDILVLNSISATDQKVLRNTRTENLSTLKDGVHDIKFDMVYRYDPSLGTPNMMPGTAAYAVTPQGARKMIDVYETIGWEQSDHIINTAFVRIQTLVPELFTFKLPNLEMSHGRNMI